MIRVVTGPLIVQPVSWTLVFNREASTWWAGLLAFGRYKHVRAYAYVPFLHVWVFYDVHLGGTDIVIADDGDPAQQMIASWIVKADLVQVRRRPRTIQAPPALGFCVPAIRRLLGMPGSALRPTAFYAECLANGGVPFEADHGFAVLQSGSGADDARIGDALGARQGG